MKGIDRRVAAIAFAALIALLALAAAAPAARPKRGARFNGTTSAPAVLGFRAPVTFRVAASGRSLSGFTFGSLGCLGAGGLRPGVDPYTGHSLLDAGTLAVSAKGRVFSTAVLSYAQQGQTVQTRATITARFVSPRAVSGTIAFTESDTGGGVNASCGPARVSFTARAG